MFTSIFSLSANVLSKRRLHLSVGVCGCMACLALTTACGNGKSETDAQTLQFASPSARYDSTAIHLALRPTADCFPFYYAQRTGIYRRLGLTLELHTYRGQLDCDTALVGRWMDGGYADAQRLQEPHMKRAGLNVKSTGVDFWQLAVSGPLRVKDASKLSGRLVAVARESAESAYLDEILKESKVRTEDVFRPQVNDVALRAQMLAHRQVDAAMLCWPYTSVALAHADRILLSQPRSESGARFVVKKRGGREHLDTKALDLLKRGYEMAVDSMKVAPRDRVSAILQRDYGVETSIADTLHLEFGGFFRKR